MKKFLFLILTVFSAIACYDDSLLWDSIQDHENRIVKLETLCNQMNTNVSSLQTIVTALQSNDFITNVSPIMENGKEIGYTVTFSKNGSITIYHGEDGKDGADGSDGKDGINGQDGKNGQNGQNGHTPIIGVRKDVDGIYYWTLNGEWVLDEDGKKIPASGKDGKDGEDGKDAQDGENGENGKDGQSGITPQLKIQEGYWYVSYDNGSTWERLGVAADTQPDSFFKEVNHDEDAVYFTLTDNTVITIPFRQVLSITFDIPEVFGAPGNTFKVPYTITGATGKVEVETICENGWKASVNQFDDYTGEITLTAPTPYEDGKILVYVNNAGYSILKPIVPIVNKNIEFKDKVVGDAYISYFDSDHDGKLSFQEAANVSSLHPNYTPFPKAGTSFNELQYFTSLTAIDFEYFSYSSIKEIILPNNISKIDQRAFYNCTGLTDIILPETLVEVGESAFYGCESLTTISLPASIKKIYPHAFYCWNLKEVYIPTVADWMEIEFDTRASFWSSSGYEFFGGYAISLIDKDGNTITDIIIPEGTTTISEGHYAHFGFKSMTLPSTVTAIEEHAFDGCSLLEEINIPSGVKSIGYNAYYGCVNIKTVKISSIQDWMSIDFMGNYSSPLQCAGESAGYGGRTGATLVDKNGNTISSVSIPEGTTAIRNSIFAGFMGIQSLVIPDGVITIEGSAFAGCVNLEEITVPESLVKIENHAFYGCRAVSTINIPSLEHWVSIDFETNASPFISSNSETRKLIENDGNEIIEITIPSGTTVIGGGPYIGLSAPDHLIIPTSVTTIEYQVFSNCDLKKVTLPSSLIQYPGAFVFSKVKQVVLQEGITKIDPSAFSYCSELEEVTIPSSVKIIDQSAFFACNNLKTIVIPEGVEEIRAGALSSTGIEKITLPASLKHLGDSFTGGATSELYFKGPNPPELDPDGWQLGYDYTIYVPYNSVEQYKAADGWKDHTSQIKGYDFENEMVVE